jgi:hypothetical protein
MTTNLFEELQTFGGDFTHCALLVRVGNSTVAIFAVQVDSAISRWGGACRFRWRGRRRGNDFRLHPPAGTSSRYGLGHKTVLAMV